LHRWIALVKALLLSFFCFKEIGKKTKNPYFLLPQQKMSSMAGIFTIQGDSEICLEKKPVIGDGDKKS
jgi:hypothetical protein